MTDDILILPEGFAIRLRDGGHITPEAFEAAKTAPQPLPPDLRAYSPGDQ